MKNLNLESLMNISYGLYIISSKRNNEINGMVGNAIMQTSAEPPTIAVCLNQQHLTHEFIADSGVFSISVLSTETPMQFIGNFGFHSGRERDKFAEVDYEIKSTGAPIVVENTVSYVEAEVINQVDIETHTIFIGRIVGADELSGQEALTYDYYHQIKNGKTPEAAPSYIKEEKEEREKETEVKKYKCEVCGYVYDPHKGDPENGIEPGTEFSDLPDDWRCPVCDADQDQFFLWEPPTE